MIWLFQWFPLIRKTWHHFCSVRFARYHLYLSFRLELNLQAHKTEVVLGFRGPDAPAVRAHWLVEHFADDSSVACVPRYEHLGTQFQSDGGIDAELSHRLGKAHLAMRQIRTPILMNKYIAAAARLRLLDTLVMPILLHGAGNWPLLTAPQLHRLHVAYLRWIRSIVGNGFWAADQRTDEQLVLEWHLPSVSLRLAKLRLLYAFHLLADAPNQNIEVVKAIAATPRSWFGALRQALAWMASIDSTLFSGCPLSAPVEEIWQWQWLHAHRESGPRLVRRLYRQALRQGYVVGHVMRAHQELQRCFLHGGAGFEDVSTEPVVPAAFSCGLCSASFISSKQLRSHICSAHGEATQERLFIDSTVCPACWCNFWTVNRLQITSVTVGAVVVVASSD